MKHEYWQEVLRDSFEFNNLSITPEQLSAVAKDVMINAENMTMAFPTGAPDAPRVDPKDAEIAELKRKLRNLKEARRCEACKGTGYQESNRCSRCQGLGRIV